MIKLSVIVPIYKVEEYIEECIGSILSQLPENVEIVCINDGSPDNSFNKAQKLILNQDIQVQNQFVFIEQENQGLSVARNTGIKAAIGEYIGFLDSDDMLLPGYFDIILNALEKNNCDILDFNVVTSEDIILKTHENSFDSVFGRMNWFAWARIYRREILVNDTFTPDIIYEDLDLVPRLYLSAKNISHIDSSLYWYRLNESGITQSLSQEVNEKTINSLYYITKKYENLYTDTKSPYYASLFIQSLFMLCMATVKRSRLKASLRYFNKFVHNLNDIDIHNLPITANGINIKMKLFIRNPKKYLVAYAIYCILSKKLR